MAEAARSLPINVTSSLTPVFTAGATWSGKAQGVYMRACNKSGAEAWITVALTRGGTTIDLLYQYPLAVKGFYAETLHEIFEAGDVISVQANANSAVDFFLSGYEGVD